MSVGDIKFKTAKFIGSFLSDEEILSKVAEYIMLLNVQQDPQQYAKTKKMVEAFMHIYLIKVTKIDANDLKSIKEWRQQKSGKS